VPRAHRLVGGVAAAAGEPTIGPCCATFGPRSLRRRPLGVSANAAVTLPWRPGIEANEKKARRGRSRAGQEGGVRCYWLIR
jgi:hypothetical protein